ncbi:hypothetical protein L3X39_06930 [Sabulilitoribacter multivorans]|uniref:Uncharacterized protein n=1 Tax=Flaviramulus multivorans TaxID=1304750 RepID=A0ABS9IHY2_9FLAO|nr:hypothetical protein [Flaviramulus multivorans]MCF7560371.1 hypothetical protein [Flaviramulus multivorans]
MSENVNKYLDDLSKKVIKGSDIESPSFNFTNLVMSQIEILNKKQTIAYKPLISRTTWVLISIGVLAIIIYVLFFSNPTEGSSWLSQLDFSLLSDNKISNTIPDFKLSKTLMYAVVLFGLMICIQVPLLKNHFDKRFEL